MPDKVTRVPYNIHLFRLSDDGLSLVPGFDRILHHSQGSEANKLYKFHGLYYHFYSEVRPEGRVPMMERARSLNGSWVTQQLMHVHGALDNEPNQGGFVETPAGKWYFLTHQGRGDWEGRAAVLLPVHWRNGWPIPGRVGRDGIGNMVWAAAKPVIGYPRLTPALSDDFSAPTLQPAWEWQYQPRARGWSLTARPGFLRLYAFASVRAPDLRSTPDILTQRSIRTSHSRFTVQLDLKGMADGEQAGLIHFAATYAALTVTQAGTSRRIGMDRNGVYMPGPVVRGDTIWLRSDWDFNGTAHFSYSSGGHTYKAFGDAYALTWGDYRGDRIGIVTENRHDRGYVDVDRVMYEVAR
jgi:beta-xylosidase